MSSTFTFNVDGIPQPQPRCKAVAFAGHARVYTPAGPWRQWAQQVYLICGGAPQPPYDGPVKVEIIARFPFPESMPKKWRIAGSYTGKKPDNDNLEKLVYDALKQRGWFHDDSRISENRTIKVYSGNPGMTITIEHLKRGAMP